MTLIVRGLVPQPSDLLESRFKPTALSEGDDLHKCHVKDLDCIALYLILLRCLLL